MDCGQFALNFALVTILISFCSAVGPPRQVGVYQAAQIAKVGQAKKRFACPVEADPLPIVQWTKDGETISEMWPRYRITKEGALRIKDVELDDAGHYVCKATNGFGHINVNYSLVVVGRGNQQVQRGLSDGEDVVDLVVPEVVTSAVDLGGDQEVGLSQEGLMKNSDTFKGDRTA